MSLGIELAKLVVKLVGETADYDEKMTEAAKKTQKFGQDMASAGKKMTMGITLPLVAAGGASISFASDLEESQSKALNVFGSMGDAVLAFADDSAIAFGMSEEAVLEYASTYGSLLKNMGMSVDVAERWSEKLVQLTADYASFHNLNPGEAFEKIKAGMVGSSEPLLSLGKDLRVAQVEAYALKNGLIEDGEAMDQLTLAQARLGSLFAQSTDEYNDFEETSDGVANSTRIVVAQLKDAAATLGQDLIPMAKDVLQTIIPLVDSFNQLDVGTRRLIISSAGVAAAMGPVLQITGGLLTTGSQLSTMFASGGFLAGAAGPIGLIAVGATAAATAFIKWRLETQAAVTAANDLVATEMAPVIQDVATATRNSVDVMKEFIDQIEIAEELTEDQNKGWTVNAAKSELASEATKALGREVAFTSNTYDEYGAAMTQSLVVQGLLNESEREWIMEAGYSADVMSGLTDEFGIVTREQFIFTKASEGATHQIGLYEDALREQDVALGLVEEKTLGLGNATKVAADETKRLQEVQAEAAAAAEEVANSYLDMSLAMKDATNTELARTELGLLKQMQEDGTISQEDYFAASLSIGEAFGLMDEKSLALAGNLPILNQLLEEGIVPSENLGEAIGLLYDEAADGVVDWENLLETMELTPETAQQVEDAMSDIRSENAELFVSNENLLDSWKSLKAWADGNIISLRIEEYVSTGVGGSGREGWDGGSSWEDYEEKANGGNVFGGVPYTINEYGPGEVFVPQSDGYVLSRGDAMSAASGGRDPVSNGEVVAAIKQLAVELADELAVRG